MGHNLESLTNDLRVLGINQGDTVFLGADLSRIGTINGEIRSTILDSLLDAVGSQGTIVTNTFTKSFLLSKINHNYIFNSKTPSYTGSLAKLFLSHPQCVRSTHPTNSFAAIGKNSEFILSEHTPDSSSYYPLQKILEVNGKQMLIGCVDNMNGLASIHLAQEILGLTKKSILKNRYGVYYDNNGKIELFRRKDLGGCSKGFYKFYNDFILNNILFSGFYGDAFSIITDLKKSTFIVRDILKNNPRYALCDDKECFTCRGTWLYNKRDMFFFYPRNLFTLSKKILRFNN